MDHATVVSSMDTPITTPTPTPTSTLPIPTTTPTPAPIQINAKDHLSDALAPHTQDQVPPSPPPSLETVLAPTTEQLSLSLPNKPPVRPVQPTTTLHTPASVGASVAPRVPWSDVDVPGKTTSTATGVVSNVISTTTPTTALTTTSTPAPATVLILTSTSTLPPTPTSITTPHISPPVPAMTQAVELPSPPMSPVRASGAFASEVEDGDEVADGERDGEGETEESYGGFDFGEYARFGEGEGEGVVEEETSEDDPQPRSHQHDQPPEQEHEHEHEHEEQRMDERTRIEHWLAQQCRMSMLFGSAEAEAVEQAYLGYGAGVGVGNADDGSAELVDSVGGGLGVSRGQDWAVNGGVVDVDSDEGAGVGGRVREVWTGGLDEKVMVERDGVRADSPLLGFGDGLVLGRDKPLPPPPPVSLTPTPPPPPPAKEPRRQDTIETLETQVEVAESPSSSPSPIEQPIGLPSLSASLTSTPSSGFTVPSALVGAGAGGVGAGQRPQQQQQARTQRTSGYHYHQQQYAQQQQESQQPSQQTYSHSHSHSPAASFSSSTQVLPIGAVSSAGAGSAYAYTPTSTHAYTPTSIHAYTQTPTLAYTHTSTHPYTLTPTHVRAVHGGSMSSLSLSLGLSMPMSLSRRPSLLRMPSLPLLGEGEVLGVAASVGVGEEEKVGVRGLEEENCVLGGDHGLDEVVDEVGMPIGIATAVSSVDGEGDGDGDGDNDVDARGMEESQHQNSTTSARRTRFRSQSSSALYHLDYSSSATNLSTSSTSAAAANGNVTPGTEIPQVQAMFHLPTAMQNQVRRSRSSQMLLGYTSSAASSVYVLGGGAEADASVVETARSSAVPSRASTPVGEHGHASAVTMTGTASGVFGGPSSAFLLGTPSSSMSSTLSSMSPSSALLNVVGSYATSTNVSPLLLPPSPLPPSAPPTRRSRAGSLSAGAALGLGLGPGLGSGGGGGGGLVVDGVHPDGGRHGHAPSVGSIGSSGGGNRDAMYIDSINSFEDVKAKLDALLAEEGARGGVVQRQQQQQLQEGGEAEEMMEEEESVQEQGVAWEECVDGSYHRGASGALGFDPDDDAVNALRTPPLSALSASAYTTPTNVRNHHAGISGTGPPNTSAVPPNTPSTPYLPKLVPLHSQQSQHSLHSHQQQHQHQHSHPYQNPQASSSQVYVGPPPPQSPGHSSQGHGHVYGQSIDQQQQQQQLPHSRNASSASSSTNAHVRSRIHSRATSKESSPAPGSPRALARLERSPSATHVLAARPLARSVSSSARAAAAAGVGTMSIPVPMQLVSAEATANTRPARPPPAPPLDLALATAAVRGVVVDEKGVGALGLRDIGMQMQTGLLESSEESFAVGHGGERVVVEEIVDEAEAEVEEEQEISDDEMDRLQFLRGLRLEDRMEEFRGVDFPSGMDDGFKGGVYPDDDDHVEVADEQVVGHSLQERPAMLRSMSRWSLGSSTMDEPIEDTAAVVKKDRKRKSFVAAFGVGGGNDSKHTSSAPSTGLTPAPAAGKEKKRGRLASFISRLSSVGSGGMVSSPTTPGGSPGKLPPIPNSPPTPGFVSYFASDPFASNLSMSATETPAMPPVPAGLMPSPMLVDPILRRMKSVESVGGIEVSGSVHGVWDPQPSHAPRKKSVSSSNSAQSVRNQTHPPITAVRPTLAKAYSEDAISAMGRKAPHIAWEKDVGGGGGMTERVEKTTVTTGDSTALTMRARSNTTGDLFLLGAARRPALYKSASASVLGPNAMQQMDGVQRKTPSAIHTRIQYRGAAVAVDDSMPPTPSSITSTDIEEEDEEEDEEDYGVEDHERGRIRREKEHEERWAKLGANVDSEVMLGQQQPLPTIPMSPPLPPSATAAKIEGAFKALAPAHPSVPPTQATQVLDQRQRLKSMPSLVNVHPSLPASASTSNFGLVPPLTSKSSKSSGFRGLVGRMGFGSSSANNTKNNSPVSSHPGTPLSAAHPLSIPSTSTNPSVDGVSQHASHFSGGKSSESYSPTTSFSQTGSHNDASSYASGAVMGRRPPKRKLVISGVAPGNAKGFQAVKAWCESFGEVKDMSRSPNGDVYVDYKSATVAETVCRVQAKVFIKGAGSVSLSWYTKKKPN